MSILAIADMSRDQLLALYIDCRPRRDGVAICPLGEQRIQMIGFTAPPDNSPLRVTGRVAYLSKMDGDWVARRTWALEINHSIVTVDGDGDMEALIAWLAGGPS